MRNQWAMTPADELKLLESDMPGVALIRARLTLVTLLAHEHALLKEAREALAFYATRSNDDYRSALKFNVNIGARAKAMLAKLDAAKQEI